MRRREKPRKRKEPKDAIISAKEEATYADILKHIKSDPNLTDLGQNVSRIRRRSPSFGDWYFEQKRC